MKILWVKPGQGEEGIDLCTLEVGNRLLLLVMGLLILGALLNAWYHFDRFSSLIPSSQIFVLFPSKKLFHEFHCLCIGARTGVFILLHRLSRVNLDSN